MTTSPREDLPDQPPVLDLAVIDGLRSFGGSGADMSERYVGLFLNEAAALFTRIQGAATIGDTSTIARAAHTLCGASGFIGARQLAEAASALEDALRASPSEPSDDLLPTLLEALTAAYSEATAALRHAVPSATTKRG